MGAVKAWSCQEEYEGTGGIVFAKKRQQAEIIASRCFGSGEGIGEYAAKRAPWADQWARLGVDIPIRVMVEHRWHFECCGCGETIDEDNLDERGLSVDGVIGTQNTSCFCSADCHLDYRNREILRKNEIARGLDMLRAEFHRRLPRAALHEVRAHGHASHWDGGVVFEEGMIYFDFPGQNLGPASLEMRRDYRFLGPTRPEFMCCAGDREAFEAWAQKVKMPAGEVFS